jgi:hypothetical protein
LPTIAINNSIATFSIPQENIGLGVGNMIVYLVGGTQVTYCFLKQKFTTSVWSIVDIVGNSVPQVSKANVLAIIHIAPSVSGAIAFANSNISPTKDLVSNGYQLNIACYSEAMINNVHTFTSIDTTAAEIKDWITDDACNINIYVPSNIETECNKNQHHKGIWGYGFQINTSAADAIKIENTQFVTIEGLQLKSTYAIGCGVHCKNSGYIFIKNNVVQGCNFHGIFNESPNDNTNIYIINNLLYRNKYAGIHSSSETMPAITGNAYIYNNTVVHNGGNGIRVDKNDDEDYYNTYEKNNISEYNAAGDFIESVIPPIHSYLYRCLSDDTTSQDYNGIENIVHSYLQFIDQENNIYKLNNFVDYDAIQSGLDLTNDSAFPFNTDITGELRFPDLWDIGAFEASIAEGAAELQIETPEMPHVYGVCDKEFIPLILYLRKDRTGDDVFATIDLLNTRIQSDTFNSYIVYTQASEEFEGSFDFGDRNIKTILIETDPSEKNKGPTWIYPADGSPLITDSCLQGSFTMRGLKLSMIDDYPSQQFINDSANISHLILENCIVEVNDETIIGDIECKIEVVNSTLIYRNYNDSNTLYLSKNNVKERIIANTDIITYNSKAMKFTTVLS